MECVYGEVWGIKEIDDPIVRAWGEFGELMAEERLFGDEEIRRMKVDKSIYRMILKYKDYYRLTQPQVCYNIIYDWLNLYGVGGLNKLFDKVTVRLHLQKVRKLEENYESRVFVMFGVHYDALKELAKILSDYTGKTISVTWLFILITEEWAANYGKKMVLEDKPIYRMTLD